MKNKKVDWLFIFTVLILFAVFGYNLQRPFKKTNTQREKEYFEDAAKHIKKGGTEVSDTTYIAAPKVKTKPKKLKATGPDHVVSVTRYNPVSKQCWGDPLVTADNSKIDLHKLKKGEIRWIAVSRDLKKKYGFGGKIRIKSGDPNIDGVYEIHDVMNKRFKNKIDILTHVDSDHGQGIWKNITIEPVG